MMPELERTVGITWSISLVLQVRTLRPREGKHLAQVTPPMLGRDGFGTRISGNSFQAQNVVKLWESPCCPVCISSTFTTKAHNIQTTRL